MGGARWGVEGEESCRPQHSARARAVPVTLHVELYLFNRLRKKMDAPCDDDVRILVKSARGESLMERLNLVVNREPSFSHS